jgi:hypothetical protein
MNSETAVDMRPPIKTRKSKKQKPPVITSENRYLKYLEDDSDTDQRKPEHYKIPLKQYRKPEIENSFQEDISQSMASVACYEGGGRSGKKGGQKEEFSKSTLAAGEKVKNLFTDAFGKEHLQKVGAELQAHGSKEKTGFMEKEADFVKELKSVQ